VREVEENGNRCMTNTLRPLAESRAEQRAFS